MRMRGRDARVGMVGIAVRRYMSGTWCVTLFCQTLEGISFSIRDSQCLEIISQFSRELSTSIHFQDIPSVTNC